MDEPKIDYIRLYFRDFYSALAGRPAPFCGAYHLAWLEYLQDGCRGLEDDEIVLLGICRMTDAEFKPVYPILFNRNPKKGQRTFFILRDGRWHQPRASGEYEEAIRVHLERCEQASIAGLASAKKRWKFTPKKAKTGALPPPRKVTSG